jgi:site-specific DNA-methyltransferase (adenine-specific)
MGKQWDSFAGYVERNGSSRAVGDDGGRHDEGYRNMHGRENEFQSWCEQWAAECLRVLKPGGHLLAFGGTRTYHRLSCGIEDAGFEIRDSLHWIYGSGFPKGKACLKPAHEPVVMARKPGAGSPPLPGLDACRVGDDLRTNQPAGNKPGGASYIMSITGMPHDAEARAAEGRWPPNILLSDEAAEEMNRQSGKLTSGSGNFIRESSADFSGNISPAYGAESRPAGQQMISYGDTGGASRFFPCFRYQAKAPPSERPKVNGIAHPTCKPVALMRWLVKLVTPPEGIVLDPFAGTGTTAEACLDEGFKCILIERDEDYLKLIRARMNKRPPSLFD